MTSFWTIAKREVLGFCVLPIAYVVLTVWLLYFGLVFYLLADFYTMAPGAGGGAGLMTAFFGGTTLFYLPLLVFAPVLTMRLLAEEKSSGTLECLMTAPVGEWSIALGKYVAALIFWMGLWLPTLLYFWLLEGYGNDVIDVGTLVATYAGVLAVGLLYMAIGLLMSAISQSQIGAALLTFLVLGSLFLIGLRAYGAQTEGERAFYEYLGVWSQMSTFAKGIIDTRYLVFDLSGALVALYATTQVLQAQRSQA